MKRKRNKIGYLAGFGLAFLILKNIRKEVEIMVNVYVTLIIHGIRTYEQVPLVLKAKVKETLIAMELDFLLPENERPKKED